MYKLLEHIIHSHIMKHLEQHHILTDHQHGFRANRSTETQLIQTVYGISKYLDEKKSVDMAILDYTKAFDKVPHKRLIHKLKYYGIIGPISSWIESFLAERTQQVVINGSASKPTKVTSISLQIFAFLQMTAYYIYQLNQTVTLLSKMIYSNLRNGKTPGL